MTTHSGHVVMHTVLGSPRHWD